MAMLMPKGWLGFAVPYDEANANIDSILHYMRSTGMRILRFDCWWDRNRNGNYAVENVVNKCVAAGIEPQLELLGQTPDGRDMNNDTNVAAYGAWARDIAGRYKGRVKFIELHNEQNLQGFWSNPNAEWYTKAMKAAYTAIKSQDQSILVISGGLSPAPESGNGWIGAIDFVRRMYAAGGKNFFDALGFHPYSWPLTPDGQEGWNGWHIMETGVRDLMVQNGDGDKQIWATEFGFPTKGRGDVNEANQQSFMEAGFRRWANLPYAGPMEVYSFKDRGGNDGDTEAWFGCKRPDGSDKPVFAVIKSWAAKAQGSAPTPSQPSTPTPAPAQPSRPSGGLASDPYNPTIWTLGSGPKELRLFWNQEVYGSEGSKFSVKLDNTVLGTFTTNADKKQDDHDIMLIKVAAGKHTVVVTFLNDAWGGSPDKDRNLWLAGAFLDGKSLSQNKVIGGSNESYSFSFTA